MLNLKFQLTGAGQAIVSDQDMRVMIASSLGRSVLDLMDAITSGDEVIFTEEIAKDLLALISRGFVEQV